MEIEKKDTEPLSTGQIVWGKLSGQPWWPAIVNLTSKNRSSIF